MLNTVGVPPQLWVGARVLIIGLNDGTTQNPRNKVCGLALGRAS